MTIDQPGEPKPLRASDADRDRYAEILRDAFAEGRLDHAEMDERLSAVWAAKTHAELEPLIRDLPEGLQDAQHGTGMIPHGAADAGPPAKIVGTGGPPLTAIAILGGSSHAMRPKQDFARLISVLGGSDVDLRGAIGPGKTVEVESYNVFGGADLIVDDGVEIRNEMISILGGADFTLTQGSGENGTLILRGVNAFGGLTVRRPKGKELRGR